MDEGWSTDELLGVALEHSHHCLSGRKFDDKVISGTQICEIAKTVANTLLASDLDDCADPMALGGQKVYLKEPIAAAVEKATDAEFNKLNDAKELKPRDASSKYQVDVCAIQGRRQTMEDKHVCFEDLNALVGLENAPAQAFFAVYDGHGGVDAAEFCASQLHLQVANNTKLADDPATALQEGFRKTDELFLKKAEREGLTCGATACAVLLREKTLNIAWLGDSQAVLCRAGNPIELMIAHKPQDEGEKKRIEENGGVVVWYGAWRVNGILSVARAIGDKKLKQWVIGEPGVNSFDLDGTEEFVVIACDGLWDVMDNDSVIAFVKKHQEENKTQEGISKALVTHCMDIGSNDNISCLVVFL